MADNRKNRNNRPKRYTGNNVNQLGDPLRMERHAGDVFRDMSRGRYNLQNIYEFTNYQFVIICADVVKQNIRQNQILLNALNYAYPMSTDQDVMNLKNKYMAALNGWTQVQNAMSRFFQTQDIGVLVGLVNLLSKSRDLRL